MSTQDTAGMGITNTASVVYVQVTISSPTASAPPSLRSGPMREEENEENLVEVLGFGSPTISDKFLSLHL